ncbi:MULTISPECIES: type VI secretion system baseplate subunit TssK [Thalassomonas]|uniref:Type VI secretion system baseplate subunit TssK n=1 Tax=Thalassomonas actiniarum TaxID=485447 RepID=A0AAE9YT74_9GAMM|nr:MULTISPECIES: type VI secretion system baseplate subunit TssK [Thalassomonas]WDD99161.1 type VI secretion system baseplate subunit TssK [Thalassomonas actiniarum]
MEQLKQVVWKEGIFISPQHFQQQALHFKSYIHNYASTVGYTNHYGLGDITVNTDLLKIGKIAITSCFGLFPDGHYFHLDEEIVLDVPQDAVKKTVYLLLPLALQGALAYGQESAQASRYLCQTMTSYNNTSSESDSLEIEVARDNIGLSIGKSDMSGFVSFPIARILETRETGEVVFDSSFVPACIHFQASVYLSDKVKMLQSLLQNRAEEVHKRIALGQENKSEQTLYKDYLWLQTLNRWLPWAEWIQHDMQYPTHQLYRDLTTLSADLAALMPRLPEAFKPLQYDQLYQVFSPIFLMLRNQLSLVLQDSVIEYPWDKQLFEKRRLLRSIIQNPDAMVERRFVLCIESSIGAEALAQIAPQAVTLAGNSNIVELVRNAMSGVELKHLAVAPHELKPKSTAAYFEINSHNELWQDMLAKGEMLNMHIDIRIPDLEVILYAL